MSKETQIQEPPLLHKHSVSGCTFSSDVYMMDCIQGMKEYPDKYFDLAVVDPPYRDKNSPTKEMRAKTNGSMKHFGEKPDEYFFMELFRISKNQIVFGANNFFKLLPNTSCFIFWDKVQVMENYADGELAWTSFDCPAKQFRYVWSGNRFGTPDNIQGVGKPTNRTHPTEKPIALYDWIFSKFSTEGMKVLDTHLGSGSSRIAAHKNKLNFVGFEIDQEYYEKQEKRFNDFKSQLRLF